MCLASAPVLPLAFATWITAAPSTLADRPVTILITLIPTLLPLTRDIALLTRITLAISTASRQNLIIPANARTDAAVHRSSHSLGGSCGERNRLGLGRSTIRNSNFGLSFLSSMISGWTVTKFRFTGEIWLPRVSDPRPTTSSLRDSS